MKKPSIGHSDATILKAVNEALAQRHRPAHFTNYQHCEECSAYDKLFCSRDVFSFRLEDAGNPGSDPICFISPEGFAYYLPALVRLTLAKPSEQFGWYGAQLLFHLCSDGRRNERISVCTIEQRRSIVFFLEYLVETRSKLADTYNCADELFQAIEFWSEE